MVRGIDSFKEWFKGYERYYTIIGGTACDLTCAAFARQCSPLSYPHDVKVVKQDGAVSVAFAYKCDC